MYKSLIMFIILSSAAYAQLAQDSDEQGKVTFRVQYSFGTNNSEWQREFLEPNQSEIDLRSAVDQLAMNNNNETDRQSAIQQLCQGKAFEDKVRMGRYLGDQLINSYDANKSSPVTQNQVWNSYGNRIKGHGTNNVGTGTDYMKAVGSFLHDCGIPDDRIAIEEYQSSSGSQQIVTVLDENGKQYNLNYSELYTTDYNPFFNSGVEAASTSTVGIKHIRYDVKSGDVVDTRMTELGHILMAVTGGRVDDPDYIPTMLQIEANYGVLTAGAYMANTQRGEFVRGIKLAYEQRPFKWLHLKAGLTYAHSELSNSDLLPASGSDNNASTGQHNVFMQFRGTINIPKLQILKRANHKLFIDTNLDISAALAFMWNNGSAAGKESNSNIDHFNVTTLDSYLVYRNHRTETRVGGGVETSIASQRTSTEVEDRYAQGMFPFPFMRGKFIKAEFTLKGDKLDIKAGSKLYFFSYGLNQKYYLAFLEKKRFILFNVGVLNHTNTAGNNYPFLTAGYHQEFQINRVGRIGVGVDGMSSLSKDPEYRIMFGLSYTPDFRDSKKPEPPKQGRERWRLRRQGDERSNSKRP